MTYKISANHTSILSHPKFRCTRFLVRPFPSSHGPVPEDAPFPASLFARVSICNAGRILVSLFHCYFSLSSPSSAGLYTPPASSPIGHRPHLSYRPHQVSVEEPSFLLPSPQVGRLLMIVSFLIFLGVLLSPINFFFADKCV